MRYAQIKNGKVINVIELAENLTEWAGLPIVQSDTAGVGDDYINGEIIKQEPILVPETPEQIIARLEGALDRYIDEQANLYRYESIRTMVTYVGDPNPKFDAEGQGALAFRSQCYTLGIMIISEVQQGRPVPTEEELIAEMPTLESFIQYPV